VPEMLTEKASTRSASIVVAVITRHLQIEVDGRV
jgi:hypothetical protein